MHFGRDHRGWRIRAHTAGVGAGIAFTDTFPVGMSVAAPVTTGIGIIIIVFLPLLTLQGLEGKLFAPVAVTIIMALSASLVNESAKNSSAGKPCAA